MKPGQFERWFKLINVLDPTDVRTQLSLYEVELPRVIIDKREWLSLLKDAEKLPDIPRNSSEPIKRAFELLAINNFDTQLKTDYGMKRLDIERRRIYFG